MDDNTDDIHQPRAPEDMPPVHTQDDVYQRWVELMGPLGFDRPALWLAMFDAAGRQTPHVAHIPDIDGVPDDLFVTNLFWVAEKTLTDHAPGGSIALLRARPGRATLTGTDLAWAYALTDAATASGIRMHPVHLATDEDICVFTPDDLAQRHLAS